MARNTCPIREISDVLDEILKRASSGERDLMRGTLTPESVKILEQQGFKVVQTEPGRCVIAW